MSHVKLLEDLDFHLIKISLKSSDVLQTISAYRLLSQKVDYPLHLGVTEAGSLISGTVKNSIGIGLFDEVRVAYEILKALGLRQRGTEIISCPTCGRCKIDLFGLVEKIEKDLSQVTTPIKVAIIRAHYLRTAG